MPVPGERGVRPAGVILAGGRSRRMDSKLKYLLDLSGKPLLSHVIDRIKYQVSHLYLSVEKPSDALARFGLTLVLDPFEDAGPLVGLMTALQAMEAESDWLLLVPCDAPLVPLDLGARLLERALESGLPGAIINYESEIQPTFSIWNRSLLPRLEQDVRVRHMKGFKQFLEGIELAELDWPTANPSPFFNVNDPAALRRASRILAEESEEATTCSV